LICPDIEIRIAGGRELHLRHLQPLGLYIANSIFVGDYLTTEGQPVNTDVEMIRDLGFEIEGDAAEGETPRRVSEDVKISTLDERLSK
jgi:biotin synthase